MFKSLGSRLRGLLAKQRLGLSWAEWLVALLAALVLAAIVYGTAADIRRQGLSREALAQAKAARLATAVLASEQYATGAPFADFTTADGLAAGLQDRIRALGVLPGTVTLLQTDPTGYAILRMAYRQGDFVVLYDAGGTWQVYEAQNRISAAFTPAG